ncbi:MlaD family protein [Haliovirga abyssi]|uniref:Mce/MlaD domain-containing protein n=1 Tax=Haliovirga abyssi TaxID=2996794 RepID=A0AAU9DDB4_9FUSO|nr:MlaD family protein [Haliovirga abyssi]BDU50312.1 hypothetical protein HLVA_08810 [Haliovirga abyssi]
MIKIVKKETFIGIFVFISIIALIIFLFSLGKISLSSNYYVVKVSYKDVSNLEIGTPVLLAGVKVGKVKNIYLDDGKVIVELYIKKNIKIRKGAKVAIFLKGVMGDLIVSIYNPLKGDEYYKNKDVLEGIDPISLNTLVDQLSETIVIINGLKDTIDKLPIKETKELIINLNKASKSLDKTLLESNKLIKVSSLILNENKKNINLLLNEMISFMKKLDSIIDSNNKNLKMVYNSILLTINNTQKILDDNSDNISGVSKNLKLITEELLEVIKSLSKDDISKVSKGIVGITDNIDKIVNSINGSLNEENKGKVSKSLKNIEDLSDKLKKYTNNKIKKEINLEYTNKNNKINGNIKLELKNENSNYFVGVNSGEFSDKLKNFNLTLGKYFDRTKIGIKFRTDGYMGTLIKYEINKKLYLTGDFNNLENKEVIIGTDFYFKNSKIYLRYELENFLHIGIGYEF